ncbi:MAG TPA: energy transducer TonB [Polyangia bacterium]|nr:energy transducer TonB [Polyangia bacterium]
MRLWSSVLVAAALHGAAFGVAAVLVPARQVASMAPPPVTVDVEVVAPRPDPVAPVESPAARPPVERRPRRERAARATAVGAAAPVPPRASQVAIVAPAAGGGPAAPAPTLPASAHATGAPSSFAVPRYRANPAPEYPLACRRRHEEGTVILNVLVRADGQPADVSVARSSGFPLLDQAALAAVRRWTFDPGRSGHVPVASQVAIPVRFSLDDNR